jgi:HEAT repeat protein
MEHSRIWTTIPATLKHMKPNPSDPSELMKKLAKSASWWRHFFESEDTEGVHNIVSELSPLDLAALDQRVRGWGAYSYYNLNNWQNLRPSDVIRLAQSKFAVSLVGLASFHHSGYVREAAVRELAAQLTGKELPFLLIRLNDWVSQVRDAAVQAVSTRIEPPYAVHFLANIRLVLRLRACGRVEKQFVDDVCSLLKRPECKEVLQAGTASKDRTIRRISFKLAAEADPSTRSSIIRTVMTDPDAVVRSWAVRHFLPDVTADELPSVIEPMLNDRFMPVRRDALWAVATRRPDLAAEPLRRALLDSHTSMRETARQFLPVAGIPDARVFYVEAAERGNNAQRFAALCGLGETGKASDVPLLSPGLRASQPRLRRAAVYAMGKLDADGCISKLTEFLSDAMPSVSREALKALLSKVSQVPLDDLEQLSVFHASFHVRRNALTLIQHADKWRKLPALLHACGDEDAKIASLATRALQDWFFNYNRSYTEPTQADFERIQSVLPQVESKLPHATVQELRACLKSYFK